MRRASPERRRRAVPTAERLAQLVADAYADAALAGMSMQRAVDVIEPFRADALSADAYLLACSADAAVARVATEPLLPIVSSLRARYFDAVADRLNADIDDAFRVEEESGRQEWLRAFAEALGEFRFSICARLTAPDRAGLPPDIRSRFAAAIEHARLAQWHLVLPVVKELLAEDSIDDREASLLLAMRCEIEAYAMGDFGAATDTVEDLRRRRPDDSRTAQVSAEVCLYDGHRSEAEELVAGALVRDPHDGGLHGTYASCASQFDDLVEAETRLATGLAEAPDAAELYSQLLALYATPTLFPQRQSRLQVLAAQASAIDEDSAYDNQVALGIAYRDNDSLERARPILEDLASRWPTRTRAHVELVRLHLLAKDDDAAAAALDRAQRIDDRDVGVVTVAAEVARARGDDDAALRWMHRLVEVAIGNPALELAQLAQSQLAASDVSAACATAVRGGGELARPTRTS